MTDDDITRAVTRFTEVMGVVSPTVQRMPALISARFDMHPSRLAALRSVATGQTRVSDVADATFLSVSAASRTVDALVEEGLLTREPDPENRRAVVLALTPAGEAFMGEIREFFEGFVRGIADEIGPDGLETITAAFEVFAQQMGAQIAAYEGQPQDA